ncbi:hypothetical protein [Kitasatospora herbaricolor]|uniref:Transposase n=1 Tax=Kitasatospora herbaricolor TaxID=68217 RepID=A0ABZ1WID5_9ACTN|nr:hypothetical protein [Kitasatospora herbaricolor]
MDHDERRQPPFRDGPLNDSAEIARERPGQHVVPQYSTLDDTVLGILADTGLAPSGWIPRR